MKHLVVGDVHGFHTNLRNFLFDTKVIDTSGNRIDRENLRVYCVGDLIDGDYNRSGDILNLEFAEEWFDAVCIGNHEFAFLGGKDFGTRRKHDRKTMRLLLNLIDKGVYVPAALIKDTLVVHGGFSERFAFENAPDAFEYIRVMWELSPDLDDDIAIFDWSGSARSVSYGDPTGGIFQLDWTEKRNSNFSQIVGHSTYYTGPVAKEYDNQIVHWNVDVGAKVGKCIGGITLDDVTGEIETLFYGERNSDGFVKAKKTYPPTGEVMTFDPKAEKEPLQITPATKSEKKNASGKKHGSPTQESLSETLTILPIADLTDIDLTIITDPEILQVYRDEVKRGNKNTKLKDLAKPKAQ